MAARSSLCLMDLGSVSSGVNRPRPGTESTTGGCVPVLWWLVCITAPHPSIDVSVTKLAVGVESQMARPIC
jgi:hypothetical protein